MSVNSYLYYALLLWNEQGHPIEKKTWLIYIPSLFVVIDIVNDAHGDDCNDDDDR